VAFVNICKFVNLGSIQYRGGAVKFFLTLKFNYIIIRIQLCRCVERKPELVAASSFSSEDDVSLCASQEAAPTPPALSTDAASSSAGSQRRCGVPLQRNQFVKVLVFSFKL